MTQRKHTRGKRAKRLGNGGGATSILARRLQLTKGIYSRVARAAQVTPQFVSRVARGQKRSRKIEAKLIEELRRIERKLEDFADGRAA